METDRHLKTHMGAKTHAGTAFVPCDHHLWPLDPKINGFPGLIVEHLCVKFGDHICIVFFRYRAEKKQADTQTAREKPNPATADSRLG